MAAPDRGERQGSDGPRPHHPGSGAAGRSARGGRSRGPGARAQRGAQSLGRGTRTAPGAGPVGSTLPDGGLHRAYLRQVFDHLISNAVNFSGDRPDPIIRITGERTGDRGQVSVTDNGVGIPPQQRERVFEAFVRLSPSSTKGSGIGLAIVKRLVGLYGGKVWIESNEPAGCTVRFTLPVLGDLSRRQASAMIETVQTEL